MIGRDEALRMLNYCPSSGVFTWVQPPKYHPDLLGKEAGAKSTGYVLIRIKNRKYKAHRLAWLFMHGEWPAVDIDHINGDPFDNRISNLRLATNPQNQANRRRNFGKATPKGVRVLPSGRYQARITVSGRQVLLGTFDDMHGANEAYKQAAIINYGQFARAD